MTYISDAVCQQQNIVVRSRGLMYHRQRSRARLTTLAPKELDDGQGFDLDKARIRVHVVRIVAEVHRADQRGLLLAIEEGSEEEHGGCCESKLTRRRAGPKGLSTLGSRGRRGR